ncbi:UbiA family prenyltransferase [Candidatus Bathyarchaeota archaeon]|nr:UbiA family prenyltransferase [Candidatus Bathyarchaeota archaeon]MBS7631344.1 UbiA family prenyltransferase [Candidatus Bathyarchaeota archaeon]
MKKVGGFIRLMRPINSAMMGFAVFVGAVLAKPQPCNFDWLSILYGFFTGLMLTAASMALNDYYDRDIDAINEPARPIPSGLVRPGQALAFSFILSLIGFVLSYLISILCLAVALAAWMIMMAYVTVGKRSGLPGNLLVSACVSIPFIYGSIISIGYVPLNVMLFTLMAFLSNTGREITKGIVDVKGDRAEGVKTLAVRYGEKIAAVSAAVLYLLSVSLTPLPWLLGIVSLWFIPFVLIADAGFIVSSILLLRDYTRENARKIKKLVLLWFIFGFLAFIFGVSG